MTPEQLERFRLKIQLEVLRVLVRSIFTGLANSSPGAAQVLRDRFAQLRREHSLIAIKGIGPEYSEMLSSEYQEALDDTLSFIEQGLKP